MATVETPAAAGVSTFAPFLQAGFQTRVGFTMKQFLFSRRLFGHFANAWFFGLSVKPGFHAGGAQ
jgi:hypothetical protein